MASKTTNDILVELSTQEICKLSHYYNDRQDQAPHIYSHLETVLQWQEKELHECVTCELHPRMIQIFAPAGNPAKTHGTFLSVGHFPIKMIIAFTLEENCELLIEILKTTERFNYKKDTYLFYAVHDRHIPILDEIMKGMHLKKLSDDRTVLYILSQGEAIIKTPSYPDEFVLESIKPEDSSKINEYWPHKAENSEVYVSKLIEYNGGLGMYTRSNKELVAWVLKSQLGQLALLQVIPEYQRRGLAAALIYAMSKDIAMHGFPAIATIVESNQASLSLFAKCGFKKAFIAAYIIYK